MAKYLQHYQEHLESLLALGGKPPEMEVVLREYNTSGDVAWIGSDGFHDWIKRTQFTCLTCRKPYIPDFAKPYDETCCTDCLAKPEQKTD